MEDSRHRIEAEALRQTVKELESVLDSVSDAFFSLDENLVLTYFNAAAQRMLHRQSSEVLGRYLFDAFPEGRGSIFDEKYHLAVREKIPLAFETYFDIEPFEGWYDVRVFPREKGICVCFQLITDRKRAEETLRESEERYRSIFHHSAEAIFLTRPDGTILNANPTACQMFGYTEEELIRVGRSGLLDPADPRVAGAIEERARSGIFQGELTCIRKDGTRFPGELTSLIFEGGTGDPRTSTILRDMSERRQAEEDRGRWERRLQQVEKAESLGRMAGAVAHHFNNLLQVVMGNLDLALNNLPEDLRSRSNVVAAMQASRRAAEIGRLLLVYLGRDSRRMEPIALCAACREVLSSRGASLPGSVRILTEFPPRDPVVLGDAWQMGQVFTHLLTNAAESLDRQSGEVTVRILEVPSAEVAASRFFPPDWTPRDENYACVEVSDTGCGMDLSAMGRVFDPFYTTKFTGRGLGLAVVAGIVRTHEGAVTVESKPGRGTVFRVYLPVMS